MNSFTTCLVRRDHSLQLAAHLLAGILSLVLLSGAAKPGPAQPTASPSSEETQVAAASSLVVANRTSRP